VADPGLVRKNIRIPPEALIERGNKVKTIEELKRKRGHGERESGSGRRSATVKPNRILSRTDRPEGGFEKGIQRERSCRTTYVTPRNRSECNSS